MAEKMTKAECFEILDRYKNWNSDQKSISRAFGGLRTDVDDILDERRRLILAATKRLREIAEGEE